MFVCPKEKDVCPPVCPSLSVCSVVTLKDSWLKHFKKLKEGVSANTRSLLCPASSLSDPPLSWSSCLFRGVDRFSLPHCLPLDSRFAQARSSRPTPRQRVESEDQRKCVHNWLMLTIKNPRKLTFVWMWICLIPDVQPSFILCPQF